MNSRGYLESYGWTHGEALKKGGIKKPILVKHKKDKKGIGHQANGSADAWWERLFDGQLKGLDVNQDSANGISFKQEKTVVATGIRKQDSPLYRMFVRGETLQGTTGKVILTKTTIKEDGTNSILDTMKTSFDDKSKKKRAPESIRSDSSAENGNKDKSSNDDKKSRKSKKESKGKSDKKLKEKKEKQKGKEKDGKKDKKSKSKGSKSSTEDKSEGIKDAKIKESKKSSKKRKLDNTDSKPSKVKKIKA